MIGVCHAKIVLISFAFPSNPVYIICMTDKQTLRTEQKGKLTRRGKNKGGRPKSAHVKLAESLPKIKAPYRLKPNGKRFGGQVTKRPDDITLQNRINAAYGIKSEVARLCGVARETIVDWSKDPVVAKMFDNADEFSLDHSEGVLKQMVSAHDNASVFFHLKTKGRRRGYEERMRFTQDVNITLGSPAQGTDEVKF